MLFRSILSRLSHLNTEISDNEDRILLPDHWFINSIDISLQDRIKACTDIDPIVRDALVAIRKGSLPPMRSALSDWKEQDGLVLFKNRCYVPPNLALRQDILKRYHDAKPAGHPGQFGTLVLLRRDYWWPGMASFVTKYVSACALCQQNKINTHPTMPPLQPIPAESKLPFKFVTTDFITDLPLSNGYDSCCVMVDHNATKGIIITPCKKEIDALGTAKLYHDNIYRRFGLPDVFLSDRGPQFASQAMQELMKLLGIKTRLSTAYHPQTDGQTERMNQEIEAYLRIYCAEHPEEWSDHITDIEFAHNQRIPQGRNESPFFLMMGYNSRAIPSVVQDTNIPTVEKRISALGQARDEAHAAHELARQRMAERITRGFKPFKEGDRVWLEGTNLRSRTGNKKLLAKREGPFTITNVLGPLTYRLKLPPQWHIHPVFHASLLTPFIENEVHGPNYSMPPPDLIDGEEEY